MLDSAVLLLCVVRPSSTLERILLASLTLTEGTLASNGWGVKDQSRGLEDRLMNIGQVWLLFHFGIPSGRSVLPPRHLDCTVLAKSLVGGSQGTVGSRRSGAQWCRN